VREFFDTGVSQIENSLRYVESLHPLHSKRRALDFGCGVGRLTQALGLHFHQVWGVDISPSMISQAAKYNRWGDRCQYVRNDRPDLAAFPDRTFDFVFSSLTLQHIPPRYSRKYIAELIRVLAPGGALLFQLPGRRHAHWFPAPVRKTCLALWTLVLPNRPIIGMYGVRKEKVLQLIASSGGQALDCLPDTSAGPVWESTQYLVTRA